MKKPAQGGFVIYFFIDKLIICINAKKTQIRLDIVNAIDIYKVLVIMGVMKHIIPEKKVNINSINIIK
ncbi:hypothetical protein A9G09_11975 [Gilliamella sp. wkB292]|nr:hypothetical protein A9G09_11975 [Gilliamella apicola]